MKLKPRQLAAAAAIAGFLSVGGISVAIAQEDPTTSTTEDRSTTTEDPTTTDDGTTRTEDGAGCDHGSAEDSDGSSDS